MELLVAINGSDTVRETVDHAVREHPDASITLLHVLRPNTAYPTGMGGVSAPVLAGEAQQEYADRLFAAATATANGHDGSVTTRVEVGKPVRRIVAFADESETDHIVIGNCARSGLSRLLLGSVTEGVIRRVAVPVTVVT